MRRLLLFLPLFSLLTAAEKETPPPDAAALPKVPRVAFTQLRADFTGDRPLLLMERMETAWEKTTSRASPVRVEPFSQKSRAAALSAADAWKAVRPGRWPASHALAFRRVQGGGEDAGEPSGFAAMLAADALMEGLAWPDALLIAGRAAPGGRPAGGAPEVLLLPDAVLPQGFMVLVPAAAEPAVRDLLLDGAAPALARAPLLTASDLDGAAAILRALALPETRAALKEFDTACAPLLAKDAGEKAADLLRSGPFRAKMTTVSKTLPWHLSARLLSAADMAKSEAPYSLTGTAARLCSFLTSSRPELLSFAAKKADNPAKKRLRDLTARWRALQSRAHPQWAPLAAKIEACFTAARDCVAADRESTKGKAAAAALRRAVKAAEKEALPAEVFIEPGP